MAHAHGGRPCVYTTKAKCEAALHEQLGRCSSMKAGKDPQPCMNWATILADGRGYCGVHEGVLSRELEQTWKQRHEDERKADVTERIEKYLAWTAEHPSVWGPSVARGSAPT